MREYSNKKLKPHYIKSLSYTNPQKDFYPNVFDESHFTYSNCDSIIDMTRMPGSCTSFRRCVRGVLFLMGCPYGTVFDEVYKVCNFASNVEGPCGNPDGCDQNLDLTSVPGHKEKFFRCTNGILYILKCPNNLFFSNEAKACTDKIRYFT
ncbi:unnamed protein product [Brachionus calyciflorus]|uniref:Chitin-binding type-2 domain-containing protein n=1 Tax=Brachionus calyciflorus TaxID=104777 RepID=A0A814CB29_9BILA|nr:unnamed protein product [Brachionus calyciflorus]